MEFWTKDMDISNTSSILHSMQEYMDTKTKAGEQIQLVLTSHDRTLVCWFSNSTGDMIQGTKVLPQYAKMGLTEGFALAMTVVWFCDLH